jgi:hypothetical protein
MAPLDGGRRSGLGVPVRQRTYANLADGRCESDRASGLLTFGGGSSLLDPQGFGELWI